MFVRILVPFFAVCGFALSFLMLYHNTREVPRSKPLFAPHVIPYTYRVAGVGVVESVYKNILIGATFPDLITEIYVRVGDFVQSGDPLFRTDPRRFQAELRRLLAMQEQARIVYENASNNFSYYERLTHKDAVSETMYAQAYYARQEAHQNLAVATAAVEVVETDLERTLVRAPISGEILQLNIRVGQYANLNQYTNSNVNQQSFILLGDTRFFHVRVDIDEEDAWRVRPGREAVAFIRGNTSFSIPLTYVYMEPYIIPKQALNGSDIERVDTRVLQVVYACERLDYALYPGQFLDVYIESDPHDDMHQ